MSCEVDALPFQAYANYGTWSIDFGVDAYSQINKKNFKIATSYFTSKYSRIKNKKNIVWTVLLK